MGQTCQDECCSECNVPISLDFSRCISQNGAYWRFISASCETNVNFCGINCASCASSGLSCAVCNPGYELVNGFCTLCPANSYCNGQTATACASGTFSDAGAASAAACQACSVVGCKQCATMSTCAVCADGFAPTDGGQCSICPEGTFSSGGASCAACAPSLSSPAGSTTEKACHPCTPQGQLSLCAVCGGFQTCLQCAAGYQKGYMGQCHQCPANTWSYVGSDECTRELLRVASCLRLLTRFLCSQPAPPVKPALPARRTLALARLPAARSVALSALRAVPLASLASLATSSSRKITPACRAKSIPTRLAAPLARALPAPRRPSALAVILPTAAPAARLAATGARPTAALLAARAYFQLPARGDGCFGCAVVT